MATQATLIDPKTGQKVVVTSGSQDAQQYFGKGYVLDTGKITPTPGASSTRTLEGTLTGTSTPQPLLSGTSNAPERSLGYQNTPLQAYQNLLKQGTRLAFDQGTKPTDILQQYASVGVPLTQPGVIGGAISADTRSRAVQIGDIYTSTMQTIQEKQKQDAEAAAAKQKQDSDYAQLIFKNILDGAPNFIFTATPEELGNLKAGVFTPEMQQKLQQAQQEYQSSQQTDNAPSSYQEWQLAGGQAGTGKSYAEFIQKVSGLTDPQKISTFNSIVNNYNKSPLIAASDRTIVLKNAIEQSKTDPSNGSNQLSLVYAYIQALDTYQSAVREGELGLVNSIDSKIGALSNSVQQIQNGQIVRPEVIKQIADSAQNIVDTIDRGAKQKAQSFSSQAEVSGVGEEWKQFISGANPSYNSSTSTTTLTPLNQNYQTLDALVTEHPDYLSLIGQIEQQYPNASDEDILSLIEENQTSFNTDLSMSQKGSGMRTDRHNNPTAFTVDVAKTAGLKEGVDYAVGDPFPDNPKLKTARLLGDPIATTIKAIDKIGFQTQAGKPRWNYINIPKNQWDSLSYNEKKNVIGQMYQHEGGSQLSKYFA